MTTSQPLTRGEMRKIFARHRGAATQLAKDVGVHKVTISNALRGFPNTSDRIKRAIHDRAVVLLSQEQQNVEGAA